MILGPAKRSLGNLSPSPEPEDDEREPTPTPLRPKRERELYGQPSQVKPDLEKLSVPHIGSEDIQLPPPYQTFRSSKSSGPSAPEAQPMLPPPSPTLRNVSPTLVVPELYTESAPSGDTEDEAQPRKRVRLASPESGLGPSQVSIPSQKINASAETSTSATSVHSGPSDVASSTVPSNVSNTCWQFRHAPPSAREVASTTEPAVQYQEPYYSNSVDVPQRAKMFAGRMFTLKGNRVRDLTEFQLTHHTETSWLKTRKTNSESARYGWEYAPSPPTLKNVINWCREEDAEVMKEGKSRQSNTNKRR